jgi:hypothetical protein
MTTGTCARLDPQSGMRNLFSHTCCCLGASASPPQVVFDHVVAFLGDKKGSRRFTRHGQIWVPALFSPE